jgi:nucleotide-binding universal stress UspA family protein
MARFFSNVLFPIDLAEPGLEKVAEFARDIAGRFDARVFFLYVVRELDFVRGIFIPHASVDRMEEEVRAAAQKKMEAFRREHFEGAAGVITEVDFGRPGEQVLKFAREHGIDLIVIGTHSRKGLEHTIFGSVAEVVVKGADVPVLTIPPRMFHG